MEKEKDWFKVKGYLHLDNKLSIGKRREIEQYVSNPRKIASHAFLPLIYKTVSQRRYKIVDYTHDGKPIRKHKKKKNGRTESTKKDRPIHYASHKDAQIYSYYANKILLPAFEDKLKQTAGLSDCVSAYRKIRKENNEGNKCNIDFAADAFNEIKKRNNCVAIAVDITSFFSTLDHTILKKYWANMIGKEHLPQDHYNVFKSITQFRYINLSDFRYKKKAFDERKLSELRNKGIQAFIESPRDLDELIRNKDVLVRKNQFKNTNRKLIGIPQGLPISAILANIYMYEFDKLALEELIQKRNIFYRRYSDDIVVVCQEEEKEYVLNFLKSTLQGDAFKLGMAKEKTEIAIFKEEVVGKNRRQQVYRETPDGKLKFNLPFVYLGFEFYGYQCLIKSSNVAKFYRNMKQVVRRKSKRADRQIESLAEDNKILYKTSVYRQFTHKGKTPRELERKRTEFTQDEFDQWQHTTEVQKRKYRGNIFRYIHKAADILNAPEIHKQYRNHWKILRSTMKKHGFDNITDK